MPLASLGSMEELVIHSQIVPMMLAHAEAAGLWLPGIVQHFALPAEAARRREVEVGLTVARDLADALARELNDEYFGMNVARTVGRGAYGLLEFDIRCAPTVKDALGRLTRFSALANHLVRYRIETVDLETCFEQRIVGRQDGLGRHANELAIALTVRIARDCIATEWNPSAVWFSHAAPRDVSALFEYFGTTSIEFGRSASGIAFPSADLERTLTSHDPALLSVLDEQAELLARERARVGNTLWERVRDLIHKRIAAQPRIEEVAQALHMSARTLQRRLENEGTEFNALLDDVRRQLAREHLAREQLSLTEIAFLLGYSDPRAFNRAFRRWTGRTPNAHRRATRSRQLVAR